MVPVYEELQEQEKGARERCKEAGPGGVNEYVQIITTNTSKTSRTWILVMLLHRQTFIGFVRSQCTRLQYRSWDSSSRRTAGVPAGVPAGVIRSIQIILNPFRVLQLQVVQLV